MSTDDKPTEKPNRGGKRPGSGRPKGARDEAPRRRFGQPTQPTVVISARLSTAEAAEFAALARTRRRSAAQLLAELARAALASFR